HRHYLVEQQELGLGCKRARDFETLAVRQGQGPRQVTPFVEQVELPEDLMGAAHRRRWIRVAQQRADGDVVLDTQRRERTYDLEGAAYAATAHFVGRQ